MRLQPQRTFTVVRQIGNHTDTATYYVRAVIRDAYTDEILKTLDLTDKGGQRFKGDWQVKADTSGQGYYVSIVTSVYTDSGYTTKSENYSDEENTYLVEDHLGVKGGFSAPTPFQSSGIDSRTLRRILSEELDKRKPKEVKELDPEDFKQEMPEMRWNEVLSAINELKTELKPIDPEKIDLGPLAEGLKMIMQAIENKEVTPATDLSPLLERMDSKDEDDSLDKQEILSVLEAFGKAIEEMIPKKMEEVLKNTNFVTSSMTFVAEGKIPAMHRGIKTEKEAGGPAIDLKKLSQ